MANEPPKDQLNTSARENLAKTSPSRTITITVPKINFPKPNLKNVLTKAQLTWLVVILIVSLIGGLIGGWLESATLKGQVLLSKSSTGQNLISSNPEIISSIAKKLSPSVVSVNATTVQNTQNFFGFSQPIQQQSEGTGIIISSNGLILTNRHVVPAGTSQVSVTLSNGTQLNDVTVIGRTSASDSLDIAILKINNAQGQSLVPVVIGDSNSVEVGDRVIAIGNALGEFQNTITSGIISGYGRNISAGSSGGGTDIFGLPTAGSSENLNNLFQTDAAINEGNSGGPLVNLNGQVIGVNTAVASNSQNIGFAIPIDEVKGLIKEVVNTGKFIRPFLGVRFIPLTPAIAKQHNLSVTSGAYISSSSDSSPSIVPGSAAEVAGLKPGDVITKVDNMPINQQNDLTSLIDQYEPGQKVGLTFVRGNKTKTVSIKLGSMPNQ